MMTKVTGTSRMTRTTEITQWLERLVWQGYLG